MIVTLPELSCLIVIKAEIFLGAFTPSKSVLLSSIVQPKMVNTNKLNTTYIVSLDTEKYNETSDSYQMMQKPNNEFIHAMINKNTSLCPDRCFKPLDK